MKTCRKCGETKPLTEFYPNGKLLRSLCKSCDRARAKAYNSDHPEKRREWARNWAANNPGRIAEYRKREALKRTRAAPKKVKPSALRHKLNPWLQNKVNIINSLKSKTS